MSDTCMTCGLPKTLCVCETIAKEGEKVRVSGIQRRYGKFITVVSGLSKDVDPKKILKELKTRLACGGTLKDTTIELQGNHKEKVVQILMKLGFSKEQIETS
ncbi:MAG: stress response translation initiation inhibitor YciH [Candidatus Aenigmarchaeota archaeon]|nr:stress response translation initiation inhibitor YciH [Candidatus Aenigmarchaeota archaeon]